jgi:hypothetical protein
MKYPFQLAFNIVWLAHFLSCSLNIQFYKLKN